MTIPLWKCDKCGIEYREGGGFVVGFIVGTVSDPANGRRVYDHRYADLCGSCISKLLGILLLDVDHDAQAALAKEWGATE